jgi:hypothetical protein
MEDDLYDDGMLPSGNQEDRMLIEDSPSLLPFFSPSRPAKKTLQYHHTITCGHELTVGVVIVLVVVVIDSFMLMG